MVYRLIDDIKLDPANPRRHSTKQIRQISDSLSTFGFNVPFLIDRYGNIIAGHGRWLAARQRRMTEVPTLCLDHLTPAQIRAFMITRERLYGSARFRRTRHIRGGPIEWPARVSLGRGRLQFPKCRHRPFFRAPVAGVLAVAKHLWRGNRLGLGRSRHLLTCRISERRLAPIRCSTPGLAAVGYCRQWGSSTSFLRNKNRFRESQRSNAFGDASTEMFGFRPGVTPLELFGTDWPSR